MPFSTFTALCWTFQYVCVLDWGAQNWTKCSRCGLTSAEKGRITSLNPAGKALPDAAQDTVSLLCCKGALLAPVQLGVHQKSQIFLSKVFSRLVAAAFICTRDGFPHRCRTLHLCLLNFEVPIARYPCSSACLQ